MKKYQIALGPQAVNILGMELDEWRYKSCSAHVATGEVWATIYDIQSTQEGRGHATKLLLVMKVYYESRDKIFGGSVALNERMAWLYKKCEIREYTQADTTK